MRLLLTTSSTLEFAEFTGTVLVPYAILSHTWDVEEVVFADVGKADVSSKIGHVKLQNALRQARDDGYGYLWVDACCIDKSSSAELSEAINSMYMWYEGAAVCYAYLSDVETDGSNLQFSRWFTRGWTLQELLAPKDVHFFSSKWEPIGSKRTLEQPLCHITGIPASILNGSVPISSASIARRMSWVAQRKTSRVEDIAYCLLGIFGVNMPLLYGEQGKAFIRLQEEITKVSDDQSLFAWIDRKAKRQEERGMLAESPSFFADSADVVPCTDLESREPHSIINGRLKIEVRVAPMAKVAKKLLPDISWVTLSCIDTKTNGEELLTVLLKKTSTSRKEYRRIQCAELGQASYSGTLTSIFVPQIPTNQHIYSIRRPPDYYVVLRNLEAGDTASQVRLKSFTCNNYDDEHLYSRIDDYTVGSVSNALRFNFIGESFVNRLALALHIEISTPGESNSEIGVTYMVGTGEKIFLEDGRKDLAIAGCAIIDQLDRSMDTLQTKFVPNGDFQFTNCRTTGTDSFTIGIECDIEKCMTDKKKACYIVDLRMRVFR